MTGFFMLWISWTDTSAVKQKFVTEVRDGNAGPSTPLKSASLRMTASSSGGRSGPRCPRSLLNPRRAPESSICDGGKMGALKPQHLVFGSLANRSCAMNITSPFFVVSVIVVVFVVGILFGASTKEDGHESH
jgi:hypothetical protein